MISTAVPKTAGVYFLGINNIPTGVQVSTDDTC